jgi:hypothetical protein
MTEPEALAIVTTAIREEGLGAQITGLKSIRFSPASEFREVFGCDDPDARDVWYVSFALKLDEGVIEQHPDDVLFKVDDQTGEVTLIWQM